MRSVLLGLTALLLSLNVYAGKTKRTPAAAANIPCLNAVNEAFHTKWDPVRDQIRTEANELAEKERRVLLKESRRLLLAKADAIKTCNSNAKNISLNKVLTPFK